MNRTRVMAIAVASGRVCYVCFEGTNLLDWALSKKASTSPKLAVQYIKKWIVMLEPEMVITEGTGKGCRKGPNTRNLIRAIASQVSSSSCQSTELPLPRRFQNKYEEAASYALAFPDISRNMPKAPNLWESEPVDAAYVAAIGLALEMVDPKRRLVP